MMVLGFFVVQRITLLKPHPTDVRQTGHEQYTHGVMGGMCCPSGQYNKTYIWGKYVGPYRYREALFASSAAASLLRTPL